MICTQCSQHNNDDVKFCRHCGAAIEHRSCSNGHTIPPGLTECPYCPKGREATVVEPSPPAGGAAAPPRKGTVMVSPSQLEASGVVPGSSPQPAAAGGAREGGRGKTMFVAPDEEAEAGEAASSPAASGLASLVPSQGASPLVGFLVSFSLDKNGMFWPIRYGRLDIGSRAESDLCLPYPEVSGKHALVNVRDNKGTPRIWCSDENSMNGTLLNGEDIFTERPELKNGDVLKIGPVELTLVLLES